MKTFELAKIRRLCMILAILAAGLPFGVLGQDKEEDPYAPKKEVPEGFMLVGGDILVPIGYDLLSPFSPNPANYWPGGIIPYEFDANVSAPNRAAMVTAMQQWENAANVQFVVRGAQPDYVHIQNSTGNNSSIGRIGGQQIINIFNWNVTFIMAHELGHCLGFDHTQTRSDRNSFVTINVPNIQPAYLGNFNIQVGFNFYGPYDFDSVMHYDDCAFSIDCMPGFTCNCVNRVITVLPPNDTFWQSRIGQRTHLSEMDQMIMSFLYLPSNWALVDRNYPGAVRIGTFRQPYLAIASGEAGVPAGGVLWIQPGTYAAVGTYTKAMLVCAPLGGVVLN